MNRAEYEEMEARRIERNLEYLDAGVVFIDLKAVYIDEGVRIGKGTVIYPCVVLEGDVDDRRKLHHRTEYQDQGFRSSETAHRSRVPLFWKARWATSTSVGPFAYLRPNSEVGSRLQSG